ncbi:MAG: alpha-2-macroglobulin [Sterolibacteriaceae bacterium]|uniref:Alpha-2-macroglobulin n=1 Tax=Candidatus Methylophosphatis roskildensis TaxID=2899263 RepID=A0A9D7E2B5_9PROT|nr:alpha-2-macroglobulin [Candidatus Methylophosphatis roskildensis]
MSALSSVFASLRDLVRLVFVLIGSLASLLFGRLQWTSPRWLDWLGARLAASSRAAAARPGASALILALLVAAGVGGWQGWKWWQARPRPVEVKFSVEAPPRTEIENEQKPNPLLVKFERGAAPIALVGKEVTQGLTSSPAIEGTWRWRDDRTLEFMPKADWPVGTDFSVGIDKTAVAPQIRLAAWEFTYRAPAFVAKLVSAEFYQDPVDPALKKAVVSLNFSHPVDPASLEKRVEMRMAGAAAGVLGVGAEKTGFVVSYDKLRLNAYLHSQPLPIPKDGTTLEIAIDRGVQAARGGKPGDDPLKQSVAIPGLYSLTIGEVEPTVVSNEHNDPEQVLVLQTSAAVHEKEMHKAVSAWLLPLHHPDSKPDECTQPYAWGDVGEVTQAVLKAGERIELDAVAAEREHTEVHSFKYKADVGRYLLVQTEKGVKSFGGYLLGQRDQRIVQVPPFPAELRILSQGALLALSGEKKVALLVRDLPGVKVDIGRVLPGQLQHLVSQSSGKFSVPDFNGSFGPDNLIERFERKLPLPKLKHGSAHYEAVDLCDYLKQDGEERRGVFLLHVQGYDPASESGSPPAEPAPMAESGEGEGEGDGPAVEQVDPSQKLDRRLILVTDLGLIAKRETDGTQVVFVQSIASGLPVAGASVDLIARNGATLGSQATDAQGMARFPKADNLTRERAPLLYLVKKAGDLSFLPLGKGDRSLDVSRFDVGGIANARSADQLGAYLFSDRGIYRPGDTFHIGMVVKAASWGQNGGKNGSQNGGKDGAKSLAGLPLESEVLDARGLVVKREKIRLAAGGFNELAHTTLDSSPTGNYTVNLYTVKDGHANQQIGSTQVKVQEFLPDRMKVSAHLSSEVAEGWVHPKDLKARVNVQNLFGTAAENRRVEATLTLSPAYPAFRSHPDYVFYDPQRAKESYSDKLADGKTNDKGDAELELGLEKYARATYRLHLLARAFEPEGGRSVSAETATLVSELPFLVGYKADGDLGYVSKGAKRSVSLIAIDPTAKKAAVGELNLQLVERKFVSVLTKQESGLYKYESRKKEVLVKEAPLSIPAAGHPLALASETPGNYAYVIRNAQGLELNRVEYSVAGQGNVTRSLERNAELQLTLDRKDYAPGDEIAINIRAPYVGAGLITIERDKVYAQQWFKADSTASVQKIRLPRDFEGNGYVSVQFVRDPASDEIFMSPLSYGIVPFATSLDQRTNKLALSSPELVKPGQPLKMKLTAAESTRAVVFAVDEGILQVARYQNADPLAHFFQKRALDVRTSQILDQILPEFRKLMAAAAPGGDAESALGQHLNPFKRKRDKPAVFWSGIVDVSGEREFSYTVPDTFNGTLRVMAVAINDKTIGIAQGKSLVRGDFVLSPNVPSMVAPGDEFEVSVGVANNVVGSGTKPQVTVSLAATPHLEVIGEATQKLEIGELREGVALFRVKARDGATAQLGSATLSFKAAMNDKPGGKSAKLATDLSVRPATPHATLLSLGSFKGSIEVPVQRDLHAEFARREAAVSPLPLVAAAGLSTYLANFPHLCTEQLVSQAVPALVLGKRPEFAPLDGTANKGKALDEVIRVLRTRQNADGGFGPWSASVRADEFASVHAIQLLLEARERGEPVPQDMLQLGTGYLQQLAASPAGDLYAARTRAQAAYLLTRQGVVTTAMLTSLRETLDAKYPKQWQDDLTAVWLAASYQLLKQESLATQLIARPAELLLKRGQPFAYGNYYDPLIRDAATLYMLARHFPARARALPPEAMLAMMKPVADNRFNTLSAAWTILALDAYAGNVGTDALGKLSIAEVDARGQANPLVLPANLVPRVASSAAAAKLRFGNDADMQSYYAISESGFDRTPPKLELRNGIEIVREYVDANGAPIKSVRIGDEITVRVRLRALDRDHVHSLAIVDLLPGGFEPVLRSQAEPQPGEAQPAWANPLGTGGNWAIEYADIREDRVVFYGSASRNLAEFSYRIKATNAGRFSVPPAYAESMYERDLQARSAGGVLTVEKATR